MQMKIITRQYGIITAIHLAATLASVAAMFKFFVFDNASASQHIVNRIVYAFYTTMLQPLGGLFILFPSLPARMPDGWIWACALILINSMAASAILLSFWKGLRSIIKVANKAFQAIGDKSPQPER